MCINRSLKYHDDYFKQWNSTIVKYLALVMDKPTKINQGLYVVGASQQVIFSPFQTQNDWN